jgi:hypothetical protein
VAAAYPREPKRIVSAGTDFEVEFRVENLTGGPNLVMTSGLNVPEKKLVTVLSNETWQAQLSAYQRLVLCYIQGSTGRRANAETSWDRQSRLAAL